MPFQQLCHVSFREKTVSLWNYISSLIPWKYLKHIFSRHWEIGSDEVVNLITNSFIMFRITPQIGRNKDSKVSVAVKSKRGR